MPEEKVFFRLSRFMVMTDGQSAGILGRCQHFQKSIDSFEELKAVVRYLIGYHGVIHVYFINETLVHQIIKVFLYLAVTHISSIHYLGLAGAVLADSQHIGNYLDIGAPPAYRRFLTGRAARNLYTV
jgi:hypothetical protein